MSILSSTNSGKAGMYITEQILGQRGFSKDGWSSENKSMYRYFDISGFIYYEDKITGDEYVKFDIKIDKFNPYMNCHDRFYVCIDTLEKLDLIISYYREDVFNPNKNYLREKIIEKAFSRKRLKPSLPKLRKRKMYYDVNPQ